MVIRYRDEVIEEVIRDKERIEELREDPNNVFLWENPVIYMKRMPRDP